MMKAPLVRSAVAAVAGILLAIHLSPAIWSLALILSLLAALLTLLTKKATRRVRTVRTPAAFIAITAIAALRCHYEQARSQLIIPQEGKVNAELLVSSPVKLTNATTRFDALLSINERMDSCMRVQGVIFDRRNDIHEGDILQVIGQFKLPSPALNPMQFDVAAWHRREGRSGELLIKEARVVRHRDPGLRASFRQSVAQKLEGLEDSLVSGLLYAMITGDRVKLDRDVRSNFTTAGIVHLLAVSGLHAGLVALLPLWLLKRSRRKVFRLLAFTFVLLTVWSFALLTGAGPSVLRASSMVSLAAVATLLRKRSNPINILSGVALIMLLLSPSALYDPGFQLSFAAVAGILLWSKPLQDSLPRTNQLLRRLGGAVGVSIAAQAATSLISIWHFHQFPVYFLPANLIAVPLATVMLYLLMAALMLESVGISANWLLCLLDLLGSCLIDLASFISELPIASIGGLSLTILQALICYGMLFLIFHFLRFRGSWLPVMMLACLLLWKVESLFKKPPAIEVFCFADDAEEWQGLQLNGRYYLISPDTTEAIPYSLRNWNDFHSAERIERQEGIFFSEDSLLLWSQDNTLGIGNLVLTSGEALEIGHKKCRTFNEYRQRDEGYVTIRISSDTIVVERSVQHTLPIPSHR